MQRIYQISDLTLIRHAELSVGFLEDDLADFQARSTAYNADKIADLKQLIDDARADPDEIVRDRQTQLTQAVEQEKAASINHYEELRFFIRLAFKNNLGKQNELGANDFSEARRSAAKLIPFMDLLVGSVSQYEDELLEAGAPQTLLDKTATLATALRAADYAQERFKKTRTSQTKERIVALNALYTAFREVEDLARLIYRNDLVTLDRYLIPRYNRPTSDDPSASTEDTAIAPSTKTNALGEQQGIQEGQLVRVTNTGEVPLTFYVAQNTQDEVATSAVEIQPGENRLLRTDDINNGTYGMFIVWNPSAQAGRYQAALS